MTPESLIAARLIAPVAVILSVFVAGCSSDTSQPSQTAPTRTVSVDAGEGSVAASVELPNGWHRARRSLTPGLINPTELLSVGTFPMRSNRHGYCGQLPALAYQQMHADDSIVTFMQRKGSHDDFSNRPEDASFHGTRLGCVPLNRVAAEVTFHLGVHDFYAFIALGKNASRRQAIRVVRSFRETSHAVQHRSLQFAVSQCFMGPRLGLMAGQASARFKRAASRSQAEASRLIDRIARGTFVPNMRDLIKRLRGLGSKTPSEAPDLVAMSAAQDLRAVLSDPAIVAKRRALSRTFRDARQRAQAVPEVRVDRC